MNKRDFVWHPVLLVAVVMFIFIIAIMLLVFLLSEFFGKDTYDLLKDQGSFLGALLGAVVLTLTVSYTIKKQTENTLTQIRSQDELEAKKMLIEKKDTVILNLLENRRVFIKLAGELESHNFEKVDYFSSDMASVSSITSSISHNVSEYFEIDNSILSEYIDVADLLHKLFHMKDGITYLNYARALESEGVDSDGFSYMKKALYSDIKKYHKDPEIIDGVEDVVSYKIDPSVLVEHKKRYLGVLMDYFIEKVTRGVIKAIGVEKELKIYKEP